MDNYNVKRNTLFPLYLSKKNKKNIILSLKTIPKINSLSPNSFKSYKINNISNYNNNSHIINIKDKITNKSNKNIKNFSFKISKKKEKKSFSLKSFNSHKSLPTKTFSSLINRKRVKNKLYLSNEEKIQLKDIIKNFQENKITTMELYKLERNYPLNSITKSNFRFLSKEKNKTFYKNRKKGQKFEINKIFLTSSNMIGKFNHKTNQILENSVKDLKFSKNINEFRKQIINSYSDYEKKIYEIKKKKLYYNQALNIFEECDEKRIKDALKMEEIFYRKKSTSLFKGKPLYLYIKELNQNISKKNQEIDSDTENEDNPSNKYFKNNLIYSNYNSEYMKALPNKGLTTFQSEKKLIERKNKFEKYLKKKFIREAKVLADSLYNIKDLPEKRLKKKKEPNYFHLNIKNLRRIIQVNSIKKNLYSIEDDDLLIKNTKKLREEIMKTENSFYTVFKRNKYTMDFLKGKIKPSTIQKLNSMKNSHFGVPC